MKWSVIAAVLFVFSAAAAAEPQNVLRPQDNVEIAKAFDTLYRFQFVESRATIDHYIEKHPKDPLGYAVRASIGMFRELDRLSILEGEFFKDDARIKDKTRLRPDPALREDVYTALKTAQKLALADLERDPSDTNALFTMTITEGIYMDYLALIDKKHASSLKYARSSQSYAVKTLAADPEFYDVYCTTGFSEYLLGSMPFFLRWFIKFDETEGSKEAGLRKLEVVASKGNYFKYFGKLLLAIFYFRQDEPEMSEKYLAQFEAAYPENPLVKRERRKLARRIAEGRTPGEMAK